MKNVFLQHNRIITNVYKFQSLILFNLIVTEYNDRK
jgi:hypothetical protein